MSHRLSKSITVPARCLLLTLCLASGKISFPQTAPPNRKTADLPTLSLRPTSTQNVPSEAGGAFMPPAKCDPEGNLLLKKYAADRPLLGPVVKIDADGQRAALFDPTAFSSLALTRADAFSPAADGGLYQIAHSRTPQPKIYVLHFAPDGSPASPTLLDADFEVYTFAAFPDGNFLVSGIRRDPLNPQHPGDNRGTNLTAVFSADGRELARLQLQPKPKSPAAESPAPKSSTRTATASTTAPAANQPPPATPAPAKPPTLDLADAEVGSDGYLYVLQRSSPAIVFVITSSGEITKKIKVFPPAHSGALPTAFHLSANRMAVSFWNDQSPSQTIVVADAQTGRQIAAYADASGFGTTFACYSANDDVFTFLRLGTKNELTVIRAEPQ